MIKNLILTSGILLLMASCHNDVAEDAAISDKGTAVFYATIDGQAMTRASNAKWDAGDKIGISGISGTKVYNNSGYVTTNGSGTGFEFSDGEKIYYMDDSDVAFTAYYPWEQELTEATATAFDAARQSHQKDFDFLWAQGKGSKSSPSVSFNFAHRMSKLMLTIKAGRDVTYEQVQSAVCYLENYLSRGEFDRVSGDVTAQGNAVSTAFTGNKDAEYNTPDVTENASKEAVAYGVILPPQSFENGNLAIVIEINSGDAGKPQRFSADIDLGLIAENGGKNIIKPGVQYNITVNVNRTGLSLGECSISPWDEYSIETDADLQ